jgi:hypothetical protein
VLRTLAILANHFANLFIRRLQSGRFSNPNVRQKKRRKTMKQANYLTETLERYEGSALELPRLSLTAVGDRVVLNFKNKV